MMRNQLLAFVFVVAAFAPAHADAAFFLEEPYGKMGGLDPTGHAAVYLTGICAASPTRLRRYEPEESGVVISRNNKVAGYDSSSNPIHHRLDRAPVASSN